jgi:hypothetical protein
LHVECDDVAAKVSDYSMPDQNLPESFSLLRNDPPMGVASIPVHGVYREVSGNELVVRLSVFSQYAVQPGTLDVPISAQPGEGSIGTDQQQIIIADVVR